MKLSVILGGHNEENVSTYSGTAPSVLSLFC